MRIYIIGGSGMLGTAFQEHFNRDHDVYAPTHREVDVRNYPALRESIKNFAPDVVINLAALCDMEACERNPGLAVQIHAHGSANAALAADRSGATYVYLSSACVFDGEYDRYTTVSLPRPISTYGKTKLMGENAARAIEKHIILRTEWCFGGGPSNDTKFIGKIFRQLQKHPQFIAAVGDKFGSLSYLPDLALALERILETGYFGTYHVCCTGAASRYDIAREFVRLLGTDIEVHEVDSSFFEKEYHAPRPKNEVLLNSEIPGFKPRHWKAALAEYVKEFGGGDGRD